VLSLDNGLVRTPPMGWLSWERFLCQTDCTRYPDSCINENLYKDMADRLKSDGFADVGYQFVNIDDCWSEMQRDSKTQRLIPNKQRFSHGIEPLADYVHSLGLKLGIYGDVGPKTCAGYPAQNGNGSGYFALDAQTFAEWGIDSFKFDGCKEDPHNFDKLFPIMGNALNATGAKIVFSCEWPLYQYFHNPRINPDYNAIAKTCNLFRNFNDVYDSWDDILNIIDFYASNQDLFTKYNGPGQWFDPDMLIIGDFGLSWDQSRAQMAMWSIWSSPLYMSNDLRALRPEYKAILQNKKVIAINQDKLGIMGKRNYKDADFEVWVKAVTPIVSDTHSYAIVYLNRNQVGGPTNYSVPLNNLIPDVSAKTKFDVYDLFEDEGDKLGELNVNQNLNLRVNPSGGVRMIKLVPKQSLFE